MTVEKLIKALEKANRTDDVAVIMGNTVGEPDRVIIALKDQGVIICCKPVLHSTDQVLEKCAQLLSVDSS